MAMATYLKKATPPSKKKTSIQEISLREFWMIFEVAVSLLYANWRKSSTTGSGASF
jgi:hypothetical protein